jgi:hypothetical protein
VTFRTSRFNQTEVRPHFINDNCFGDDCAAWLVTGLRGREWADASEPWQEDWGWQFSAARAGHQYLVSVGLMEEDEPAWLVHVQEYTGWLTRIRGKAGPSALRDLVLALHGVLSGVDDVRHIRWHFEDTFRSGKSVGEDDPLAPRTAAEA